MRVAARKSPNASQFTTTAGITLARALPRKSSRSEIGVARSGSRVAWSFSPTIEYTAIASGMIVGKRRKYIKLVLNITIDAVGSPTLSPSAIM